MISWVVVYVGFAALGPLCALMQVLAPASDPLPRVFARSRRVDWAYWIVTPLFTGLLTRVTTLGIAAVIAFALGLVFHDANDLMDAFHARSPIAHWPFAVQALVAFLITDFVSYWSHRLRHHRLFFPLHAVHHAPSTLDWLAAARMHPLDDLADNVLVGLPILLLGFDPSIFVMMGPLLIIHTLYLHASVRLDLGPLRYVLASPDFHRAHHSVDVAARDTNFGGVLSIWDVMFGTFRMRERATVFGLDGAPLPETLFGQLIEPIRRLGIEAGRSRRAS
jgi:sterol desaturase/sphingolipid hydroxylase (fatty acid hydroxylase superfamily)